MEEKNKGRLSIFSDLLMLCICLLIIIGVYSVVNLDTREDTTLALVDVEDDINIIIDKIYKDYNVKVIYGNSTKTYAQNVDASIQTDVEDLRNQLEILEDALKKYPIDFFKEQSVTIILLDKFSNNNLALASKNSLNEYKIYLSDVKDFERSFHHEAYHIFEYIYESECLFTNWSELNPIDFKYNEDVLVLDSTYVYNINQFNNDTVYFVTKYSKTSEKEDKAEIFAEIMINGYGIKKYEQFTNLYTKIESMQNILNTTFEKIPAYWNNYKEI